MQTAKDERLHELTLAYIDKSQLQKNGWLMAAVATTLGIFRKRWIPPFIWVCCRLFI
ncbi:hypothetical protein [Exiguobacterium artemiae]